MTMCLVEENHSWGLCHHYKVANKYVFKCRLKIHCDDAETNDGKLLHARAATTRKARSPIVPAVDELERKHRLRPVSTSAARIMLSAMETGAVPLTPEDEGCQLESDAIWYPEPVEFLEQRDRTSRHWKQSEQWHGGQTAADKVVEQVAPRASRCRSQHVTKSCNKIYRNNNSNKKKKKIHV